MFPHNGGLGRLGSLLVLRGLLDVGIVREIEGGGAAGRLGVKLWVRGTEGPGRVREVRRGCVSLLLADTPGEPLLGFPSGGADGDQEGDEARVGLVLAGLQALVLFRTVAGRLRLPRGFGIIQLDFLYSFYS